LFQVIELLGVTGCGGDFGATGENGFREAAAEATGTAGDKPYFFHILTFLQNSPEFAQTALYKSSYLFVEKLKGRSWWGAPRKRWLACGRLGRGWVGR
jgi:hypothetical protein